MSVSVPEVLVLGAGGHAKVLIDILQLLGTPIRGVLEPRQELWGKTVLGVPIIAGDEYIFSHKPDDVLLVNGLGSIRDTAPRRKLYERWKAHGYRFASVIHPKAVISRQVNCGEGVQVMAGALMNAGVTIGENCVINTGAILEHDCTLGAHVHIAPGARLAGSVKVGQGSHVGMGASVLQNLCLGEACLIAAGSVVVDSVERETTVMGVPAKAK
ncbi:MAG: acetyltransferase [Trueperaceae bacterium]|nr:acetyltransferase [Trueperaceae bacterium]